MADEQVILTRFTADLTEIEAAVESYDKSLGEARAASDGLDKSTRNLGAATGDLAAKMKVAAQESAKAAQSTASIAQQAARTESPLRRLGRSMADFAKSSRDGFRQAIREVGGFRGAISQLGANVSRGIGAVTSGFKGISTQLTGIAGQLPIVGGLASALGPVGIAASAAAGGLLAIAKNTDAGATAIDGIGRTGGLVLDRLTGYAVRFGDSLKSAFGGADGAGTKFIAVLAEIGSKFTGILTLGASTIFKDALEADAKAGQELAEAFDKLKDVQSQVNLATAQNEIPLRKNLALLRDTTKPVEERLRIADEITRIEGENLKLRRQALKTELDIVGAQIAQQIARKGEADDPVRLRFEALRTSLAQVEADSVSLTERVGVRRAQIVEQEEQRKQAARDKALEAQRKAAAESVRIEQERVREEAAIAKIIEAARFETAQASRDEAGQELAAIRKKYADIEAEAQRHFEKLRELAPASEQSALVAREAEALLAIDAARNAAIEQSTKARLDKLKEEREQRLKLISDATKTEIELERDGINERFDQLEEYAKKYIDDEGALTAALAKLAKERARLLYDIEKQGTDKALEERKRAAEASVALFGNALSTIQGFINESYDRRIAATQSREAELQEALQKAVSEEERTRIESELRQTQQQKEQLEQRKKQAQAFAIAATLIQTYQAAQSAYASQLVPGDPSSLVRATAAAAIAIAAGLLNVARIRSSIQGAYEGEEYVSGKQAFPGKDGHLRRLHTGERVVTAKANKEHWDALDAMHRGRYDEYIESTYIAPLIAALAHRDDGRVAAFNDSDTGQRLAQSVMLAKFYDANIVGELKANRREARAQTELLAALARSMRPASKRYW